MKREEKMFVLEREREKETVKVSKDLTSAVVKKNGKRYDKDSK